MAIYSNLTVDQGSNFLAYVDVTDSSGNALDLNGYTVAGQIRKTYSSLTAVSFSASVSNALGGTISLGLSDTVTNAMKPGRYVYDVEILNSNGTRTRVLEGQVEVTPGVTQV
jgi:hypothetical protein|tara:strand:- start:380 stop:715 length:336 start_codon:yes stop_codon:yes gene_type:complete